MSVADYVPGSVCWSNIHPDTVSAYYHDSVLVMMRHEKRVNEFISLTSGPRIASARNQVVRDFLAHRRSEWLVMCDSDMVFAPNVVDVLLAGAEQEGARIVGSLCYGATVTGKMNPTLFRLVADERGKRFELYESPPPKGTMVKVDATGTGCVLIHRDVLVDIGERWAPRTAWPWFSEGELVYDGQHMEYGEDVGFCIKAGLAGHDIWVNTAAEVHHAKTQVMTPRHYRNHRRLAKQGITHEQLIDEALVYNRPEED